MKLRSIFWILLVFPSLVLGQNQIRPNVLLPAATNMQVNSYSGVLYYERTDLFIPARGDIDFDFTFYYNSSLDTINWGYGYGWTHNYNMNYVIESDTVTVMKSDGRRDDFVKSGNTFQPPTGVFDALEEYEPDKYRLHTKFGMKYFFDDATHQRLTKIEDRNGNTLTFAYTGSQLMTITGPAGRQITMTWQNGVMASIVDALDTPTRTWTYQYDADGNLEKMINPLPAEVLYAYEGHKMIRMTDENGGETVMDYFETGGTKRVATCFTRHTFSYQPDDGKTVVTELVGDGTQTTTYEFDSLGRNIARQGNCCGNQVAFTYDANNNITSSTDANGNTTTYDYDAMGNNTGSIDPMGCTTGMIYEPEFNQGTSFTDKNGNTTHSIYDEFGNLTEIQRPLNITESYAYDEFGNQIGYTDGNGNTTTYDYSTEGYLIQTNHPIGGYTTQFTYDGRGNKLSETDANGHSTFLEYDALNRLVAREDPLGNRKLFQYDANGNRVRITNELAFSIWFAYDELDRLVERSRSKTDFIRFEYDSRDNILFETDGRGNHIQYVYNDDGMKIKETDPLGNSYSYTYDRTGKQASQTNTEGGVTQYQYDKNGRLLIELDPLNRPTIYSYDCNGNVISRVDANGYTTKYQFDELNRQIEFEDGSGNRSEFGYDMNSNLVFTTDARGYTTSYSYNEMNLMIIESHPDGTDRRFTYDGESNVLSRTDNSHNSTLYFYDDNNRIIRREYPDQNNHHFEYDNSGRLLSATNSEASVNFQYDSLDRVVAEGLNGNATRYIYNNSLGKRTILYPSGLVVREELNEIGLLSKVFQNNRIMISYTYDGERRLIRKHFGNGMITETSYDESGRLIRMVTNPDSVINYCFSYDNVGNLLAKECRHHSQYSQQFRYDSSYQLISFEQGQMINGEIPSPDQHKSFEYDPVGNRLEVISNGVSTKYFTNNMNEYVLALSDEEMDFEYDANGNLVSDEHGTYSYNFENQRTGGDAGITCSYIYDALDRRIGEVLNGDTTYFFYDNFRIIEENRSGLIISNIYGRYLDEVVQRTYENNIQYLEYDHIGSVVHITDESFNLEESYSYQPFGSITIFSDSLNNLDSTQFLNNIFFAGRRADLDYTGYDYRSRHYDVVHGRFLSRDQGDIHDGFSLYWYARNNPLNFVDPFGTNSQKCCDDASKKITKKIGGFVTCCNGTPIACVGNLSTKVSDLPARSIIRDCILKHEGTHIDDGLDSCPECEPATVYEGRHSKVECNAHNTELICLKSSKCPSNDPGSICNQRIDCRIRNVRRKKECYCRGGTPEMCEKLNQKCVIRVQRTFE